MQEIFVNSMPIHQGVIDSGWQESVYASFNIRVHHFDRGLHIDADELFQQGTKPIPYVNVRNEDFSERRSWLISLQSKPVILRYLYDRYSLRIIYPLWRLQYIGCCQHFVPSKWILGDIYRSVSPQYFTWRSRRSQDDKRCGT